MSDVVTYWHWKMWCCVVFLYPMTVSDFATNTDMGEFDVIWSSSIQGSVPDFVTYTSMGESGVVGSSMSR